MSSFVQIKRPRIFQIMLGLCLLLAYLFFLDEQGSHLRLYLYNFYFKSLPLELSFYLPFAIWLLLIITGFLLIRGAFVGLALLIAAFAVFYLKSFSVFAQCSWGTVMPYTLLLLGGSEFYRRARRWPADRMPLISIKAIELTLSLIYFSSVTQRLLDPSWLQGDIVKYLLESRTFSRFPSVEWEAFSGPLQLATYYALIVESLGAFLIFMGRHQKKVILALIPIHVGLALVSTELVWQLFCLAMLFLIYQKSEVSSKLNKGTKSLIYLAAIIFYVAALPLDMRLPYLVGPVSVARHVLEPTGLLPLTELRLFHARPTVATCFYIYGKDQSGYKTVKGSDPAACMKGENYIFQDNLLHATVRSYLDLASPSLASAHLNPENLKIKNLKVAQDLSDRWGYASCKALSRPDNPLDEVIVTVFTAFESKGKVSLRVQTLSYFSCQEERSFYAANLPLEALELLKQDYLVLEEMARKLK